MEEEIGKTASIPRRKQGGTSRRLSLVLCGKSEEVDTDADIDKMLKTSHATARRYSVLEEKLDGKLTTNRKAEYGPTNKRLSNSAIYTVSDEFTDVTDGPNEVLSLYWLNNYPIVTNDAESALLLRLLPYGKIERGMMKDHPIYRVQQIAECSNEHDFKLEQALSLRRYHICLLNPNAHSINLGLGSEKEISGTAKRLKNAVSTYLHKCDIPHATKEESFEEAIPEGKMEQTPDFFLPLPIDLTTEQPSNRFSSFTERTKINWIEVKMCYGVSTIPSGATHSIGSLLPTARKFVKLYGPGAFLFAYGCGASLRCLLRDIGVSVLDSHPLNLTKMHDHQRTWCANDERLILP